MSRYLISFCLILLAMSAYGQKKRVIWPDSVKGKFIPTGIRVGTDLIGIAKPFFDKSILKEYEFNADIDFYRYFFTIEYGITERAETSTDGTYTIDGNYLRIGAEINFLHRDPDQSALFFGIRRGMAKISDQLTYTFEDSFWGPTQGEVTNTNLTTAWTEMTTGLKVKIYKTIWLGYTARFKIRGKPFENKALIPYWIPGYGRADETVTWGINYWLIFRIPVRKTPSPYLQINLD